MNDARAAELMDAHFNGPMSREDRGELNELLIQSPAARQLLLAKARVHVGLTLALNRDTVVAADDEPERATPFRAARRAVALSGMMGGLRRLASDFATQPLSLVLLAAAIVSAGLLIWQFSRLGDLTHDKVAVPGGSTLPSEKAVARLTRTHQPMWSTSARQVRAVEGTSLYAGDRLLLKSGLAEIVFETGATATVEGPAEMVLTDAAGGKPVSPAHSAVLASGRMAVQVPAAARGFTVLTPTCRVVDVGTEFGLVVDGTGATATTEVHVLRGEVQVFDETAGSASSSDPMALKQGEGLIVRAVGPPQRVAPLARSFVRNIPVPTVADVAWPEDRSLRPGDIVALTRRDLKLVKIDPETGAQSLLATGKRGVHGDWTCLAVDRQGNVLVGARQLPSVGCGILRLQPRRGAISVLAGSKSMCADPSAAIYGLAEGEDEAIFAALHGDQGGRVVRIDPQTGNASTVAQLPGACGLAQDVRQYGLLVTSTARAGLAHLRDGVLTPWLADSARLGEPQGVAVQPDGQVLVASSQEGVRKILHVGRESPHKVTTVATLPSPERAGGHWNVALEAGGSLIVSPWAFDTRVFRIDSNHAVSIVSAGGLLGGETLVAVVPPNVSQP